MQKRIPIGGDMAPYLDLLARYRRDPESVPVDWKLYFEDTADPSLDYRRTLQAGLHVKLREAVSSFRTWGHLAANIDPLEISHRDDPPEIENVLQQLEPHLKTEFDFCGELGLHQTTVASIISRLRKIYADRVGVQFDHLLDSRQRTWLYERFERGMTEAIEPVDQLSILNSITQADEFEKFLQVRFPTKSRFGIEGAESFLVFLQQAIETAARAGFQEILMGGMHRGRLNMLANVMGKPLAEILAEVKGRDLFESGSNILGDVPYHLGYSGERSVDGQKIRLSISSHPSHLMAIAPVVLGRTRAKQSLFHETGPATVLCMLLHTDAAFSGQGLTSELLQLGGLKGFSVGGTIHCIVNNQLGFTTLPCEGRASRYCTDMGRAIEAPIFHVNSEFPETVLRVARLAIDWRREFGQDAIIDLVCYRRNGHNEFDEPRFTQPRMYAAIDEKTSMLSRYVSSLSATIPDAEIRAEELANKYRSELVQAHDQIESYRPSRLVWLTDRWSEIARADEIGMDIPAETGVDLDRLREFGRAICSVQKGMRLHPKIVQFQNARLATIENGQALNWATAESLAIASLVADGTPVRLSGQDAVRGTFTQRHWALHDVDNGETYIPLQNVTPNQALFEPINSPLSEYAVLAFEYGYSLVNPGQLVIWEAQFGDFANGAQTAVDQFVVSAEQKWLRMSSLTLLLPHGLEGHGPDHSSARVERFLQLCAGGNMFVANCSTPANFFHLLRRQVKAKYRKPLIALTPKSMLRHKDCVSDLAEMGSDTKFKPVLADPFPHQNLSDVERVILCSGKIFYELDRVRNDHGVADRVALVRLEQLYPLSIAAIVSEVERYPRARVLWCQEEPENQGAWQFILSKLHPDYGKHPRLRDIACVARNAASAPSCGSIERHNVEQAELLKLAVSHNAISA